MKYLHNQKGMTLIIVLLTITIFTVLGLAVIGSTINNSKQIRQTEQTIQTSDLAEMGSNYYQIKLEEFLFKLKKEGKIEETIKDMMSRDFEEKGIVNINLYHKEVAQILKSELKTFFIENSNLSDLRVGESHTIDPDHNASFTVFNPSVNSDNSNTLVLTFDSEGTVGTHISKALTTNLEINFNINSNSYNITSSGGATVVNFDKIIRKPTNLPNCIYIDNSKENPFKDSNCQFNSPIFINKHQEIAYSTILVNGSLYVNSHFKKGIDYTTLYVTGSSTFSSHINGINNSNIYIGGALDLSMVNQGIINSTIVAKGSATFNFDDKNGKIKGFTNSSIYIGGAASFRNIDIKKFDPSSKICVAGVVDGIPTGKDYNVYSPTINQSDFHQYCSVSTGGKDALVFDSNANFFGDWNFNNLQITYQ